MKLASRDIISAILVSCDLSAGLETWNLSPVLLEPFFPILLCDICPRLPGCPAALLFGLSGPCRLCSSLWVPLSTFLPFYSPQNLAMGLSILREGSEEGSGSATEAPGLVGAVFREGPCLLSCWFHVVSMLHFSQETPPPPGAEVGGMLVAWSCLVQDFLAYYISIYLFIHLFIFHSSC